MSPGISHQCSISVVAIRGLQKCSVTGQCHAWYNHDGKEQNSEIEAGVAETEFPLLAGNSSYSNANASLQIQRLLAAAGASLSCLAGAQPLC